MNQYLLLRDNKQTGPYTAEELSAKGLKPYDLVWLEGKSAAWRYPSELADLKPFAPVVEEQPYDRFYKKTDEEVHPMLDKARMATQNEFQKEKLTVIPEAKQEKVVEDTKSVDIEPTPVQPEIQTKKIYVTLPASNRNGVKKELQKAASFSQTISTIAEERRVTSMNDTSGDLEKITQKDLYAQLQENERARVPVRKGSARPVMFLLVAACLLLFGVIIGLYISNKKQEGQNKKLEDLVKQIEERERNRDENPPVSPQQPVQDVQQASVDSSNVLNNGATEMEKKLPVSTVSRKGNSNTDKQPELQTIPVSNTADQPLSNQTDEEAQKEKTSYPTAAIESARKNIHQMLLVENSKFKTGVLGGISNLHMTLSNNSRFPLDQVEIEIKYFGPEQKLVKTQMLLFNDLAPGEQKTLEAPRTSRGVTIDYAITRINSKVLGLAQQTQF